MARQPKRPFDSAERQVQDERLWEQLLGRLRRAYEAGCYLEVLAIRYILLERQLRVLLFMKLGNGNPDPTIAKKIGDEDYLAGLALLAHKSGLIDDQLLIDIQGFNDARAAATHGLAQGRITYDEIEATTEKYRDLEYRVQSQWLTWGKPKLSQFNVETGQWEEISSD